MYDEAGHVLGEYNSSGTMVYEYVWLGDIPIAVLKPKTGGVDIFYINTDHLNTPRKITTSATTPVTRWTYNPDPFGKGGVNENPSGAGAFVFNLRFPGQYFDSETGNHYNYFRTYDPSTGRYVESDPIGLRGGINTYSYANARPNTLIDLRGLLAFTVGNARGTTAANLGIQTGLTEPSVWVTSCTCKCSDAGWVLSECAAKLDILVTLRDRYPSPQMAAWALRVEQDHVFDILAAQGAVRSAGEKKESEMKGKSFESKAVCELRSQFEVKNAMQNAVDQARRDSNEFWDFPKPYHIYSNTDRRP